MFFIYRTRWDIKYLVLIIIRLGGYVNSKRWIYFFDLNPTIASIIAITSFLPPLLIPFFHPHRYFLITKTFKKPEKHINKDRWILYKSNRNDDGSCFSTYEWTGWQHGLGVKHWVGWFCWLEKTDSFLNKFLNENH